MKKVSKENKEKIMEMIKKAGSEEYETEWDAEGRIGGQKKKSKIKQGKLNRASGRRFEVKVRADLEKMRWIVDKWANTIDLEKGKLIPAKPKFVFNHQLKRRIPIGISSGFPDFVCFKKTKNGFDVIGLEVKANGYLDKIERGMCLWLLENKIFSRILIAKKAEKRGQIDYVDFAEKHNKT